MIKEITQEEFALKIDELKKANINLTYEFKQKKSNSFLGEIHPWIWSVRKKGDQEEKWILLCEGGFYNHFIETKGKFFIDEKNWPV